MKPRPTFELEVNGKRVRLGQRTLIMGVLNVTPDSFSDGGEYLEPERAIEHGVELVDQGADWLDVGGESTKPGSRPVTAREELRRVLPVIQGLRKKLRTLPISIDTTKAEVAEEAVRAGASIINDVSGLRFDPRLAEVAGRHRTPLILMHLRGRPETMQENAFARSIWRSLRDGLERSIRRALARGIHRSQLIIDPGMGFGKSRRQNFEILAQLERLHAFHLPILIGTSRKSFVQAVVVGQGLEPSDVAPRIGGAHAGLKPGATLTRAKAHAGLKPGATLTRAKRRSTSYWPVIWAVGARHGMPLQIGDAAAVAASILGGAHIVRVHDVAAIFPAVRIAAAILATGAGP
ncbi:MAG: dihydropteroate synthase [Acidobacteriia bacterium]|nr:dihydropteroate synthase [Terriglobia bacterium]